MELIVLTLCGTLFIYLGWRIWKKGEIGLINSYHYSKVGQKDKKAYTTKMGQAVFLIGAGTLLTGVVDFLFHTFTGWFIFGITFATGLLIMVFTQLKYNKGIF